MKRRGHVVETVGLQTEPAESVLSAAASKAAPTVLVSQVFPKAAASVKALTV